MDHWQRRPHFNGEACDNRRCSRRHRRVYCSDFRSPTIRQGDRSVNILYRPGGSPLSLQYADGVVPIHMKCSSSKRAVPILRKMLGIWLWIVSSCVLASPHSTEEVRDAAFEHVDVIPMDRRGALLDQTVLVAHGIIVSMGPSGAARLPKGIRRIEGRGHFLMPGLADMHAHIGAEVPGMGLTPPAAMDAAIASPQWDAALQKELWLYIANGVTTIRNMAGSPSTLNLIRRIETGQVSGPRIVSASPIIDGDPPSNPQGAAYLLTRPEEAHALVTRLKAQGYQFVKVYNMLSPQVYFALASATHAEGLKLVGHVPFKVGFPGVLQARQDSVEHLRGYDFDPNAPPARSVSVDRFKTWLAIPDETLLREARETAAAGIWNCPTLVINKDGTATGAEKLEHAQRPEMQFVPQELRTYMAQELFPPEVAAAIRSTVPQQMKMVKLLNDSGARLLAGTDSPLLTLVPGFALHREIELLVEAGLPPYDALRTATVNAQEFIGDFPRRGTVTVGADADLILIAANPLEDVANTRRIEGVMLRGAWYSEQTLRRRLGERGNGR